MKRRARVDANHADVRDTLRDLGWTVIDCSRFGDGFSDLIACRRGVVLFVEVKDGSKSQSRQRLTQDEQAFRDLIEGAGAHYRVVRSIQEAVDL